MRHTTIYKFAFLLLAFIALPFSAMAQEIEYNWTNGSTLGNSWFDPENWGIDDGTSPNNSNAIVGIGSDLGFPNFSTANPDTGVEVLTLDVATGGRLDVSQGFITFADRTAGRPFSLQSRGAINVTGNTASLQLKDEAHNFSTAVISLHNGGSINVNNGDALLDTSNENAGNGTIELSSDDGEPESQITGSGGAILTIDKQTILGHGSIGTNSLGLVFGSEIIVDSNVNGRSLVIDGDNTTGTVNQGVLKASNGGTLDVRGAITNTYGLIEAEDGSALTLSDSFEITGGTVRTSGTGTFATSGSGRFADVTLDGTSVFVDNGRNLELDGTITNQGAITIGGISQSTDLRIDGAVTLEGGGTVTLTRDGLSRITDGDGTGGVLTNVDNTIEGRGNIGSNQVQVINQADGTIDANSSGGTLALNSATATGSVIVNRGVLTANSGGNLRFNAGDYDNVDGLVEVGDDSFITLATGSTITGGTVRNNGTGSFAILGTTTFEDLTVEGEMDVQNGSNLALIGTIQNEGNIRIGGVGQAADLQIDDAASLTGGGTVTLTRDGISRITDDDGGGVLTNVDNTIQGRGNVGNGLVQIINEAGGTIDANSSGGTLALNPGTGAALVNRGLITASGGNLQLGAGDYDNVDGLIEVGDDSTITLSSGSKVTGGTVRNNGTGSFATFGTTTFEDLTLEGEVDVQNGSNLALIGAIENEGNIRIGGIGQAADLQIDDAVSLTGGGTVTLTRDGLSRITDDDGDGVLTNVDNTIRGRGRVGNDLVQIENLVMGVIQADQSGASLVLDSSADTFDNFGTLSAVNNSLLDVLGTTSNSGIVDAEAGSEVRFETLINTIFGQLVGDGTIDVTDEIINSGTIPPGNSPGMLTLDADLELVGDSLLEIELAGLGMFDELVVNGALELGGDLELVLLDGYTPDATDIFDVVMANGIAGQFDNISDGGRLVTTNGIGSFQVNYGSGGTVQLSLFSAVPEPGAATILMAAGLALVARRRKKRENCE